MAEELRELGLTEEELENIAYVGNKSVSNTSTKTPKKLSNGVKHKTVKKGSEDKKRQNKKSHMVGYLKSPGSDSDSSYESSDNFYSSPRGLEYKYASCHIGGGRGKPFYPNAVNPCTPYNQGGADTYNHINRMTRELKPLIQGLTDSTMFRNDSIEEYWSQKKNIPKPASNSTLPEDKNYIIKTQSDLTETPIEPKTSPVKNIGKPLNSNTNILTPVQPYKNALTNGNKNETKSSSDESSLNVKLDTFSIKISSNNFDKVDTNVNGSNKKKKDDKVIKTQLYIPPHMRKRNAEIEGASDSASDCSVVTPPVKHETPDSKPVPPKPEKKSVVELTRKNVLISGLLKKKREQSSAIQTPSEPSPALSSISPLRDAKSYPQEYELSTSPSSCRPDHSDYSDPDPYSPPCQYETPPPPSSPTCELPRNLIEFYDIEEPPLINPSPYSPLGGRSELPLRPPPEFGGDDSNSYYYYDEDTKQFVHYRIPESSSASSNGVTVASSQISHTAVNGSSSSLSSLTGSVGHSAFTSLTRGPSQAMPPANGRNPSGSSVNGRSPPESSGRTLSTGNAGNSSFVNGRSSATGRGLSVNNPPSNPNNVSYSNHTKGPGAGFWPPPSSESDYYDEEYPSLS
ncbi:hypothetical protein WDU94_013746 [Cyamophila willieti]